MRVYISADMEGTAGVTGVLQTMPQEKQYEAARRLMVAEVNAAIAGAYDGGATYVRVNDSHDGMRNLLLDELDPRAELVSGAPKPLSMVEGIERGFDVMLCTGYHGMAGRGGGAPPPQPGPVPPAGAVGGPGDRYVSARLFTHRQATGRGPPCPSSKPSAGGRPG